jgi:hypothetical protein
MQDTTRRAALTAIGLAAGLAGTRAMAASSAESSLAPSGAKALRELMERLDRAPRRRDFKTVPMILDHRDQWDHEALTELMSYRAGPRQVWDNTDLASPWLNTMRNSLNTQIWSYGHADFLVVSATHGSAHFALYDQAAWDKYQIGKLTGGKFAKNVFVEDPKAASADPADFQNANGVFSPHDNSIGVLQRRGVVFLACHNAIWEHALKLNEAGLNPDKLSQEAMVADLTNHLLPGVILSPGVVGTLPELHQAGFSYVK